MSSLNLHPALPQLWRDRFGRAWFSIGAKIVLPYFLLTLVVAGVGAFIVVRLVTASLQERFHNQLLDAGRVVSENMVALEEQRLEVLRMVVATEGVAESMLAGSQAGLAQRVPQIIANSQTDVVELIDLHGRELYGWQRPPGRVGFAGEARTGADYSREVVVQQTLAGFTDELGDKHLWLGETPHGLVLFTVGPIYHQDKVVGAAMVGTYLSQMVVEFTENAVARVTLYDTQGQVLGTTLGGNLAGTAELLQEPPDLYQTILALLRETPQRHAVVVATAEAEVPLQPIQVLGQEYSLAYGDWRLRDQSLGFFSVALPRNFVLTTAATSRNTLSLLFSALTIGVIVVGFAIAQRIITPLNRLVQTSVAVVQGDLAQRTGIRSNDEIGSLAESFDTMTDHLVERNRLLVEQASELEAILNSTADGIIVLDQQGVMISSNPAARHILTEVSADFLADILRELPQGAFLRSGVDQVNWQQSRRYEVGNRVFSAVMAPVRTPSEDVLGTVVALRDVSREVEAERLKDSFITSISHELRTPLTSIKMYTDLMTMTHQGDERQLRNIQTIERNTNKLLHHITQIIDISEIQAGSLNLKKSELDFVELIGEGVESWRTEFAGKGLSFELNLPAEAALLSGDAARLSWAVDNLLSNAYHYTLRGGVSVTLRHDARQIWLAVADTGVGIAPADQPFLFTRFFRAKHQAMFEVAGVGLGLYITRSLIELHGGQVWFESEPEVGSTFYLTLPLL